MKSIQRVFFALVIAITVGTFTTQSVVAAEELNYVSEISYDLEQPIGGVSSVSSAGDYLQIIYQFALGIVGIMAVVLIMFGGIRWISAAGNEQIISDAKEIIVAAVIGLAIALLSYSILVFINPRFTAITFSLERLDPTFNQENIFNWPKCTEAKYASQKCITETGGEVDCSAVPCGVRAAVGQDTCRGQTCAAEDGKCYADPVNSDTAESCQLTACGEWVEKCKAGKWKDYKISSLMTDETAMRYCTCGYYFHNPMVQLGYETNTFSYDDDARSYWQQFCQEGRTQDDWVTFITPYISSGNPANVAWNCANNSLGEGGMQCDYEFSTIGACIPQ